MSAPPSLRSGAAPPGARLPERGERPERPYAPRRPARPESALAPAEGPLEVLDGRGRDPADEVATGPALLRRVSARGSGGWLRVYRPAPAVAFSRRDGLHAGYDRAVQAAAAHGFAPVVRAPGGRAVAYHEGALCLELLGSDPDVHRGTTGRYVELAAVLVEALTSVGVDARAGAVPDEYCPGRYSVNGAGRVKLAGTAQRVVRGGWFLGAVLLVDGAGPVRDVIDPVYRALELRCDVATIGSASELCPGLDIEDVAAAVRTALSRRVRLEPGRWPDDQDGHRPDDRPDDQDGQAQRRARDPQHAALPCRAGLERTPALPTSGGRR